MKTYFKEDIFMSKINLKGINASAVARVLILILAITNAILQMLGYKVLPIENSAIEEIVSGIFLVAMTLYNTYKNLNVSTAAQTAQSVTDAIKNGEITVDQIKEVVEQLKNR